MPDFRNFLLNEQQIKDDSDKRFFGQKVGDVLTAIHDLEEDGKAAGNRKMTKVSLRIVNQIRAIIHDQWGDVATPFLPILQRVGVAMMKAIEEKGDINEVLASAGEELENIMKKLGVPINQIGSGLDDSEDQS
jgi:hypothetical protein